MLQKITKLFLNLFIIILVISIGLLVFIEGASLYLRHHQKQVAGWLSELTHQKIELAGVRLEFIGLNPALLLNGVIIKSSHSQQQVAHIKKLYVELNIIKSIYQHNLIPNAFLVSNIVLNVNGNKDGMKYIMPTTRSFDRLKRSKLGKLAWWLLKQNKVYFKNITINYCYDETKKIKIQDLDLELLNDRGKIRILGQGNIVQTKPAWFNFIVDLASKKTYFKINHLNISPFMRQATGNIDIESWINWQNNFLQQLQVKVSFHKFASPVINITRGCLTANLYSNQFRKLLGAFKADDILLQLPRLSNNEFNIANMTGQLDYFKADNRQNINIKNLKTSNADFAVDGSVSAVFHDIIASQVKFKINYSINNVKNIAYYYPSKIMPAKLVAWLDQAVSDGKALHGHASFDKKFSTVNYLQGFVLKYDNKWPLLNDVTAKMSFNNFQFNISGTGKSLNNLVTINSSMADMRYPLLKIKVYYQGENKKLLNFFSQTSLANRITSFGDSLSISGPVEMITRLVINLQKYPATTQYKGEIKQTNGVLCFPKANLKITNIGGKISFANDYVRGKNVTAEFLGKPLIFALKKNNDQSINIHLSDKISAIDLKNLFKSKMLTGVLAGECSYTGDINIYQNKINFTVLSNLLGLTIHLPKPFAKSPLLERSFMVDGGLVANKLAVNSSYGSKVSAIAIFTQDQKGLSFYKANLMLGGVKARLPQKKGLTITGYLPLLNFKDWRSYFKSSSVSSNRIIDTINLKIGLLKVFEQKYLNTVLRLVRKENSWLVTLYGAAIDGTVLVPTYSIARPIVLNFNKLKLVTSKQANNSLLPDQFPALKVNISNLLLNASYFKNVKFTTTKLERGVQFDDLRISINNLYFSGGASWLANKSSIVGTITSDNFGAALQHWGLLTNLNKGAGQVNLSISWAGSLFNPTLSASNGSVMLYIKNGIITNLGKDTDEKIGLGRILNLFSLQTITNVLTLNFSSFTHKGFVFKLLQGYFTLKDGVATTDSAILAGDIAHIALLGKIGLAQKDYDLTVTIIPYLTSSLPLVATVAGGPIAGAVTWVADQFFKHTVQKSHPYKYRITGSWHKPNIVRVN